jgi:suppressor for copper-sensitivity B
MKPSVLPRLPARRGPFAVAAAALVVAAVAACGPGVATAAAAGIPRPEKAKLALQADASSYPAGAAAGISAQVSIEPGWHVNSHTPTFDYLIPTALEVEMPAAWPAAEIQYPPAQKKKFTFAEVPLSVYDGDVTILAVIHIPEGTPQGRFPLHARLSYQACNDSQCLPPVSVAGQVSITVGAPAAGAGGAPAPSGGPAAATPTASNASTAATTATAPTAPGPPAGLATPHGTAAASAQPLLSAHAAGGDGAAPPAPASATTATTATPATTSTTPPPAPRAAAPLSARTLAGMLLVAVLGGLILNAMPCVLPILSLKVFGMVRSAGHGRSEVTRGALATAAGIVLSFLLLAGAAIAAAAAGAAVGWGVQFQRPGFVAFLLVVVTLFCFNLWGLFEIPLPGALARLGGAGGAREGLAGHFVSGLFATLMATPCSAPFLGTAIGFALAQPAPVIVAIFAAVGVGLALPYLILAAAPGAARLLPRPGPWMDTLRGTLGFVLAGSAVWLLYVLGAQVSPERLALLEVGLVLMGLCTWLRHRAEQRRYAATDSPAARPAAAGLHAVLAGLAVLVMAVSTIAAAAAGGSAAAAEGRFAARSHSAGLIGWVAFDRARAESLAAGGQLVFVDVTADWCFTCKVNERLVLDTPEIAGAFARHHVLPMRADWTNRSDEIAHFLAEHGRYGIPFYLLYRPGRDPYVFSEVPTKGTILAALAAATS